MSASHPEFAGAPEAFSVVLPGPLFQATCGIPIRDAEGDAPVVGGTVRFASPDGGRPVDTDRNLSLSSDEAFLYFRPAIDILSESTAGACRPVAIIPAGADEAPPMA